MRDLRPAIVQRIQDGPPAQVWTPVDFLDLGSRAAVDKVLQRLVAAGQLRRIDRGLYTTPRLNRLTNQPAGADYRQIIDALARRDQLRMLVDGMTAANDLGFTSAVPARVVIHTDTRRRAIHLDNLTIAFKQRAPSKLYWSGRPAMRIVQALQWLKDTLPADRDRILAHLSTLLADGRHGRDLRSDLRAGLATLPAWMQDLVRELLGPSAARTPTADRRPRARTVSASSRRLRRPGARP